MRIGIIGTGNVAKGLAPGFIAAGHDVFFGSRDPAKHESLPAPAKGYDALASAEIVVAATPGVATLDVLMAVGSRVLDGKILVDPGNALDARYQLAYPSESLAGKIQAAFPGARVVKAFNTYGVPVMVSPSSLSGPSASFIAGNDSGAKKVVRELHVALGWRAEDVVDLGGIEAALAQERYFALFMALVRSLGTANFNIAIVRSPSEGPLA